VLAVARRLALAPELLAAAAPEPGAAGRERAPQRLLVHPAHHEHLVRALLLDDGGDEAVGVVAHRRQLLLGGGDGRRDGRGGGVHGASGYPAPLRLPQPNPPASAASESGQPEASDREAGTPPSSEPGPERPASAASASGSLRR